HKIRRSPLTPIVASAFALPFVPVFFAALAAFAFFRGVEGFERRPFFAAFAAFAFFLRRS
ncbi:MAG: hypothetical protein DMF97_13140, partial [Acidobacteria bacterium]